MYYTVYKVTNKVNGKIYIGCHKTKNLDDGYMGSGVYLKRSQKIHGMENFEKEILFVFDNANDMFAKEAEIVTVDFLAEENTYNLTVGGFGGWDYVNNDIDKVTKSRQIGGKLGAKSTNARYPNLSKQTALRGRKEGWFNYKNHSEETKLKISRALKGKCTGKKNSSFGTKWFHDPLTLEAKRLKPELAPKGWVEGRKPRKRKSGTKGYIWLNDGVNEIFINPKSDMSKYTNYTKGRLRR